VNGCPYPAFSGYGIELEYILVDGETLNVRPIADRILAGLGPADDMDIVREHAAWSNELALHVLEMKTLGPIADFDAARRIFRGEVNELSTLLAAQGARLMPSGAHPWMDPASETRLWPHQNDVIYRTFDRIFDCRGHGWSNLQSMHINFPFQNETEFVAVHAACRFVLPLLPALAASSPFLDGARAGALDARLATYETNCQRVPAITGQVVPEVITSRADYDALLSRIYAALVPLDPEGTLAEEWVNARGAIARFERCAVEIRVLDTQECPEHDVAIAELVTTVVQALAQGELLPHEELVHFPSAPLVEQYQRARTAASAAPFARAHLGRALGSQAETLGELWRELIDRFVPPSSWARSRLDLIANEGTLAERLVRDAGPAPSRQRLHATYEKLCTCLREGQSFCP